MKEINLCSPKINQFQIISLNNLVKSGWNKILHARLRWERNDSTKNKNFENCWNFFIPQLINFQEKFVFFFRFVFYEKNLQIFENCSHNRQIFKTIQNIVPQSRNFKKISNKIPKKNSKFFDFYFFAKILQILEIWPTTDKCLLKFFIPQLINFQQKKNSKKIRFFFQFLLCEKNL